MQDSELQFLGAGDADLVSLDLERNRIAGMSGRGGHQQRGEYEELFHVSLLVQRACELARTLGAGERAGFRDLRHPGDAATTGGTGRAGTVTHITFAFVARALAFRIIVERHSERRQQGIGPHRTLRRGAVRLCPQIIG